MSNLLVAIEVAFGIGLLGLIAWLLWRARVYWAGAVLALLGAALLVIWFVDNGVSEGDSLCLECGRVSSSVRVLGLPIPFTVRDHEGLSAGDAFARAFSNSIPPGHSHDWERIGCTRSGLGGRSVSCRRLGHPAWFLDLVSLADREVASRTASKFAALPRADRVELLTDYPVWIAADSGEQRFADWRKYWVRDHPAWQ